MTPHGLLVGPIPEPATVSLLAFVAWRLPWRDSLAWCAGGSRVEATGEIGTAGHQRDGLETLAACREMAAEICETGPIAIEQAKYAINRGLETDLATGLAIWALGQTLAITGYITPTSGAPLPQQPPEVLMAVRVFVSPVPIVLLVLAILCAWRYPITRERHRALRDELAAREV